MSRFKCGGLSLGLGLRTPPPQISWVSAGKQGELQRRQGLPRPSPAGALTLAPALARASNEFYLSCGVLSATRAVDQTKRLYRCSAVIHFSAKGRSIRSPQRALGELGRKEPREIQTLCVSEPRERRSPWRGSPEGARRAQETRRRRRGGVRLRGRRRSGAARGGWDRGGSRR